MRYITSLSAALPMMLASTIPTAAQLRAAAAGKPGGELRPVLHEDLPQGFAIHETATHVKDPAPHSVVYSCCRLQETWLDK